jgi:hypothetical protein
VSRAGAEARIAALEAELAALRSTKERSVKKKNVPAPESQVDTLVKEKPSKKRQSIKAKD